MKSISLLLLSTAFTLSLCVNAKTSSDEKIRYAGDLQYSGFCRAIVKDDVSLLKRSVGNKIGQVASTRRDVLEKLISENGMKCNGKDLIKFSQLRGAKQVYAYLTEQQ